MAVDANSSFDTANNSSLVTDFNVSPYYDDYDKAKNFYRILYKPGYPVQARELTQMQTILQNQIARFGKHVFKEGSIVLPGAFLLRASRADSKGNPIDYVKIKNNDTSNNTVDITQFKNQLVKGASSNISAYIVDVLETDGTTANTKTLYVNYLGASPANSSITKFIAGETLTSNVGTSIVLDTDPVANVGYSSWFSIDEGVFYAKEHFIYFPSQSVVLSRYNDVPTCKVGFYISEKIINQTNDTSLLDPALESSNYSAPGADRLQLVSELTVTDINDTVGPPNFVTLFTIKDGIIQTLNERSSYNILGDVMASRTYDESGDYVTKGMTVQISEHDKIDSPTPNYGRYANGNNNLLVVSVDPGYAYVKGYGVPNYDKQEIDVSKPLNYRNVSTQLSTTTMGQYVRVNEYVGSWQVDQSNRVYFYDVAQKRITNNGNTSGGKWSTAAQTGNNIGSAIINSIQYVSGTPGYDAQFDLYLSDITMNGTNTFANVKSIYNDNPSYADFGADIYGSNTYLREVNKSALLYYVGSDYVKTVRDSTNSPKTSYYFNKTAGISSALSFSTGGTLTLTHTGPVNEILPYGTTTLASADILQDIIVTSGSSFNIGPLSGTVAGSGSTLTGVGTYFTRLNVGDKIEISGLSNTWYITAIANNTNLTVSNTIPASVTSNTIFKAYKNGDIIDFTGKGVTAGAARTVSSTPTTLTFDMKETLPSTMSTTINYKIATTNSTEATKTLNPNRYVVINCATAGTTGPFCLGFSDVYRIKKIVQKTGSAPTSLTDGTDVTAFFALDNGQRDTMYDLAKLNKSNSVTLSGTDYLLVQLDYFTPNYTGKAGYFSINSYPIEDNDANSTNSTIRTENIPVYVSPTSALRYDLRNHIDFRPIKNITANDATTVAGATNNPSNVSSSYVVSASGLHFPVPDDSLSYDYSYYLGRTDIVVSDKDGNFTVTSGVPTEVPITPTPLDSQMILAILNIAPYPSLSPAYANALRRKDLSCNVKKAANRVYTMRDIGVLDKRIQNLEYYTSLTLLEKDALNLKIVDENGLDRFKNGIFVDTFKDTSLTAKGVDPDYRIVTDPVELCIRPLFSTESVGYDFIAGSGVKVHDNGIVTLNYTEAQQFTQPRVTDVRLLERGTFTFQGEMTLFPNEDIWVDTSFAPDEIVSIETSNTLIDVTVTGPDTQNQKASIVKNLINTTWENWKASITGYNLYRGEGAAKTFVGTYTSEEAAKLAASAWTTQQNGGAATLETIFNNSRIGTNYFANQSLDNGVGGAKLISSDIIPYIRPQKLASLCVGLKGYSKMSVFFDGVNVTKYCTPLNEAQFNNWISGGTLIADTNGNLPVEGSDLIVDTTGTLRFLFRIPSDSPKFRTGQRRLVVVDNTNVDAQTLASTDDASTVASSVFFAEGTKQTLQRTVYSTKGNLVTTEPTEQSYTSDSLQVLQNTWTPPPPPKGHCCFDADAKILMADLTLKAIKDVVPGDKVVGDNNTVNTVCHNKKVPVGERKMLKLKDATFYTTDDHLFLTKKGWKTWRPDVVLSDSKHAINQQYLIGENRIKPIDLYDELKKVSVNNSNVFEYFVPYADVQAEEHKFDPNHMVYDLELDGNKTYIVNNYIVHNCCVAYTVLMRAPDDEEGLFVSSFDVFIARKSTTRGLWFELREVSNTGQVTNTQVPGTRVYVPNTQITESTNGRNNPLNVKFTAPVFLMNKKEYAFIIHSMSPDPFNVDPDTQIWISRLGQTDINTNTKVNDRQGAGQFFQTTNNSNWYTVPDMDMTINVYRAKFTSGSTYFTAGNKPLERMLLTNLSQSLKSKVGEDFTSGDRITLSGANGTIYVGNTITGNISTGNANGYVIAIPGTNQYLMSNTHYRIGEKVNIYNNGVYANITATISAVANASATLTYIDESATNVYTEWSFSSGNFKANDKIWCISGDGSGFSANIANISNWTYSAMSLEPRTLDFVKTSIDFETDTYAKDATSTSGFEQIFASDTHYFKEQKSLYGRTNETNNISGNHSNILKVNMASLSEYVSPVFDLDTSHTIFVENLINANTVGETASSGGQALNKYISQTITLADGQEAEDLNVLLTSYRPPGTDVIVYVKLLHQEDNETFKQKPWLQMVKANGGDDVYSSISDRYNYKEYKYLLPTASMTGAAGQVQYTNGSGTTFTGYKYFAIKIVLTADNPAIVPRVADLRCIALQI